MRIFISYPDADRRLAQHVKQICEALGHECFVASDSAELLSDPQGWFGALFEQIDKSDVFILCLNPSSLDAWVQQLEWKYVAPRRTPQKLIIHEGAWDTRYKKAFPAVQLLQYYCVNDDDSLGAFKRALPKAPPEEERFEFMRRLVIDSGTRLMMRFGGQPIYGTPTALDSRKNPAIDVDVEIQGQIVRQIREAFPNDGILAEERDEAGGSFGTDREFVWTVDPLDGTLNFMSGDDRFCCGVGLLSSGQPFMGAVFVPSRMELYTGGVGRRAECFSFANSTVTALSTDKSVDALKECRTITHINSEPELVDVCFAKKFPKRLHKSVRRVWMWGCGLLSLVPKQAFTPWTNVGFCGAYVHRSGAKPA